MWRAISLDDGQTMGVGEHGERGERRDRDDAPRTGAAPVTPAEVARWAEAAERACARVLPWAPDEHAAVVQEALARVVSHVRERGVGGDLAGYAYEVARRCALERRRALVREALRREALPPDELLVDPDGARPDARLDADRRMVLEALRYHVVHVLARRDDARRRAGLRDAYVLVRHILRGVPLDELARELGVTRRACRYALQRALADVRRLFRADARDLRSVVANSEHPSAITEVSACLRRARS